MALIIIGTVFCLVNVILWLIFFAAYKKHFSAQKILADIRNEVNKLLIEISREADADITLIDERRRGLKKLLEEADRRIMLADNQQEKRSSEKKVLEELHKSVEEPVQTDLFAIEVNISEEARHLAHDLSGVQNIQNQPVVPPPIVAVSPPPQQKKVSLKDRINELHNSGMSNAQIAERLKVSLTEIQLAIQLGYQN